MSPALFAPLTPDEQLAGVLERAGFTAPTTDKDWIQQTLAKLEEEFPDWAFGHRTRVESICWVATHRPSGERHQQFSLAGLLLVVHDAEKTFAKIRGGKR